MGAAALPPTVRKASGPPGSSRLKTLLFFSFLAAGTERPSLSAQSLSACGPIQLCPESFTWPHEESTTYVNFLESKRRSRKIQQPQFFHTCSRPGLSYCAPNGAGIPAGLIHGVGSREAGLQSAIVSQQSTITGSFLPHSPGRASGSPPCLLAPFAYLRRSHVRPASDLQ